MVLDLLRNGAGVQWQALESLSSDQCYVLLLLYAKAWTQGMKFLHDIAKAFDFHVTMD